MLKPFAGQRVGLFVCEPHGDFETMDTWAAIANILAGDTPMGLNQPHFFGADWKEVPTNMNIEHGNCGGTGIGVAVSKEAPPRTREAARTLALALFGTLPPSIYNHFGESDPKWTQLMIEQGSWNSSSSAAAMMREPDLIVVEINAHPVQ